MWLVTTRGFYSVVCSSDDPEVVVVGTRTRSDLDAILGLLGRPRMVENGDDGAFPFHVRVPLETWARAVGALAREIKYPTFTEAVAEKQGDDRAGAYQRAAEAFDTIE
jgi:hypothetical protein